MTTAFATSDTTRAWARDVVRDDPVALLSAAGYDPDPWQVRVLTSEAPRVILLVSRQAGKSLVTSAKALATAQASKALVLVGSPSQNQSIELLNASKGIYNIVGSSVPIVAESVMRVTLANGSRMICVPGTQGTVRGYSFVRLLIVDEAAYVDDAFYQAVFPMVAISHGRVMLLSTPHAKSGAFYEIWANAPEYDPDRPAEEQPDAWLKIKVTWEQCPRITQATVDEYRFIHGDIAYRREWLCEFQEAEAAVFTRAEVDAINVPGTEAWPLW